MMLVDTHTHLYLPEFEEDRQEVVTRAVEAGVGKMILPNVDLTTIEPMKKLRGDYPDIFSMAIGLHPTEVNSNWREALDVIKRELDSSPGDYSAIGEIGIDLYWDKTFRKEQMDALKEQLLMAAERDLPVIIHCREGLDEILEVIQSLPKKVRGVFHSFGGSSEEVTRIRNCGDFFFGINGISTFKNSKLRQVLPAIGLERILLETDSPYLAPVPFRGKRNESAYIVKVAQLIADVFGTDLTTVAEKTTENAKKLFGI